MNKFGPIFVMLIILGFGSLILRSNASANSQGGVSNPIPPDVMKIAGKSCVNCHSEPGNGMALMHLNLSTWNKYNADKQAAKAKDICKMVTKGKMPPKKFRDEHPDGVPSAEEIQIICKWADSLQPVKK
jgi:hypothetical protein